MKTDGNTVSIIYVFVVNDLYYSVERHVKILPISIFDEFRTPATLGTLPDSIRKRKVVLLRMGVHPMVNVRHTLKTSW